jgi:hypothetical protein
MKRLMVFDLDGALAKSRSPLETKTVVEAVVACEGGAPG